MSGSGKHVTVVISCTTTETVRVSRPALYYEADRLHVIYMASKEPEKEGYYESLVDEIERQVRSGRDMEVVRHDAVVYRFNGMLHLIDGIIKEERERDAPTDVYVNISSGTPEYAAAAMCACMMNEGCTPFSVAVKEHSIPFKKFAELTSAGGRPVGDAAEVSDPRAIETFNIDPPDRDLVTYLLFFDSLDGRAYTTTAIMNMLGEYGIWKYVPTKTRNPGRNAASVQYRRTVLSPLVDRGWLENGPTKNRWRVTRAGKAVLDIFTDEDERRSVAEMIRDYSEVRSCMMMAFREEEPDDDSGSDE